jgi:membrane protease YdiL (CAAX protease family)
MILIAIGMPSVVAIILTALINGRSGLIALFSHLGQWREPPVMIAAAVLVPLVVYAVAYFLQGILGGPAPVIRLSMLAAGLGSGLFSGPFEEFGWRGFVLPRLLKHYSPLKAALLTGIGWGVWHFFLNYIGMRQYGNWMYLISFLAGPVLLTGFSMLMTWVYTRVHGSLLVMVLFHVGITTCALFFSIPAATLVDTLRYNLVICAVIWVAVALVVALGGFQTEPSVPSIRSSKGVSVTNANQ